MVGISSSINNTREGVWEARAVFQPFFAIQAATECVKDLRKEMMGQSLVAEDTGEDHGQHHLSSMVMRAPAGTVVWPTRMLSRSSVFESHEITDSYLLIPARNLSIWK